MFSRLCGIAVFVLTFLGPGSSLAGYQQNGWDHYRNERFGYSFFYPSALLKLRERSRDGDQVEFISVDGQTKLKVFSVVNQDDLSPNEYRAMILRELHGANIEYEPAGRTWFVLSGVRGPSIYYQKVMFACGGRIINAFSVTYPQPQRRSYDAIITAIEKSFRPASGPRCNTGTG